MSRPSWFIGLEVILDEAPLLGCRPPEGVRVFDLEDLHVTVAFFGGCHEQDAWAAWEVALAHRWTAIEATLGEVVPFGDPRRPTALSAELDAGRDEATALIAELRPPLLEAAGARPDRYRPRPHVTLARPQRGASALERREAVEWATTLDVAGLPVLLDSLALYTWSRRRSERLFDVADRSPPAPGRVRPPRRAPPPEGSWEP